MGYYIDLQKISIEEYKSILRSTDFLPSWKILEKDIDRNLDKIIDLDIQDLEALIIAIKTKTRLQKFAIQSGLSVEYLTILRRVINGYLPKPNKWINFPKMEQSVIKKLESIGIKNTLQLYDLVLTPQQRIAFSKKTNIPLATIKQFARLADLSRIKWVNHTFAYVLYHAGFQSAQEVAEADHKDMFKAVKAWNQEKKMYKGTIGVKDMQRCVESAKRLDIDIIFD